jgi:hypothetical protein
MEETWDLIKKENISLSAASITPLSFLTSNHTKDQERVMYQVAIDLYMIDRTERLLIQRCKGVDF